ncbi:MAG: hypothetical protein ACQERE_08065 [Pseudomonadota bacterium]
MNRKKDSKKKPAKTAAEKRREKRGSTTPVADLTNTRKPKGR